MASSGHYCTLSFHHIPTRSTFPVIRFYRVPAITACLLILSACSWQGAQQWRRSVCEELVNADDRERCLEEAMQSEGEYREKVRQASDS